MGGESATSGDVFVSGGYDHCVKLWDARLERMFLFSGCFSNPHS